MNGLNRKVTELEKVLNEFKGGALVAFSGGTDSTLLLVESKRVLGDRCAAFTADSPSIPRSELEFAAGFATSIGVRHFVVKTSEMDDPDFLKNGPDRCFFCKRELFTKMRAVGEREGFSHLLLGAVSDDLSDFRPGMDAARVCGARFPLLDAGFSKADVRERSRALGLQTWDKPSAACLASRVPIGREIRVEDLGRVEKAEEIMKSFGFRAPRVRLLGDSARIELNEEETAMLFSGGVAKELASRLKMLGFYYVTVDLEGYRPAGSQMNGGA